MNRLTAFFQRPTAPVLTPEQSARVRELRKLAQAVDAVSAPLAGLNGLMLASNEIKHSLIQEVAKSSVTTENPRRHAIRKAIQRFNGLASMPQLRPAERKGIILAWGVAREQLRALDCETTEVREQMDIQDNAKRIYNQNWQDPDNDEYGEVWTASGRAEALQERRGIVGAGGTGVSMDEPARGCARWQGWQRVIQLGLIAVGLATVVGMGVVVEWWAAR